MIRSKRGARIDYIKIVDIDNLEEVKKIKGRILIAVAVFFGKIRLIDNAIIRDERMNMQDKMVYWILNFHADQYGNNAFPSWLGVSKIISPSNKKKS